MASYEELSDLEYEEEKMLADAKLFDSLRDTLCRADQRVKDVAYTVTSAESALDDKSAHELKRALELAKRVESFVETVLDKVAYLTDPDMA